MAKNDEVIEDILDDMDDHGKRLKVLENSIFKILDLLQKMQDTLPFQVTQPVSANVEVKYQELKNSVYDGMAAYYHDQPDHTGILSEDNLDRIHNIYCEVYNIASKKYNDEVAKEKQTKNELIAKQRTIQGIYAVDQVADWAPEYPVEIQRLMRFIGLNILPENEPVESVHKILRIWADAFMQITNQAEPKSPTLKAWFLHKWNQIKPFFKNREKLCYSLMLTFGMSIAFSISLYQNAVMELDRTNRIFYKYVMKNQKRTNDYHELDSLIHSNSFFKTYRTLE